MSLILNLGIGLLFGIGLVVSGMANPAKILNFLDLAGTWDPSLAFVMGGAVAVAFIGFRLTLARDKPLLASKFQLPTRTDIDARVITGPVLFGVGWGLGGYCPGPALTALGLGAAGTLAFVPAMLLGFWAARSVGEPRPDRSIPRAGQKLT